MKSQEQKVLDYIREHGSITTNDAYRDLHITQLGTRIFNLRAQGYDIQCDMTYKGRTKWGRYTLLEGKRDNGRTQNVC